MGKKRERGAKDDDGQKKKHKKSKHRKHHKPKLGGGGAGEVVKGVEASPGSRLTLKIKLGNKELRMFVKKLLPTVEGLECIIISDRDGVALVEAHTGTVPSGTMKPPFLATFSIASEQASKLGMGKNRGIVSYYSGHQVVQFNHHPLVVTFVAQTDANTGLIYSLEEDLKDAVGDLKAAVNVP